MINKRTNALHLFLIERLAGPRSRSPEAMEWWRETQSSDEMPERRSIYLSLVGTCWSILTLICGAAVALVGYGLARVNHSLGYGFASTALAFTTAFCLTGLADAIWRSWLVGAARRRYRAANRTVDDRTRKLMRIARLNDGTVIIQLGVALLFAWRFYG